MSAKTKLAKLEIVKVDDDGNSATEYIGNTHSDARLNSDLPAAERARLRRIVNSREVPKAKQSALHRPLSSETIPMGNRDFTYYDLIGMTALSLVKNR